jgi:hypothetical protein
LLCCASFWSIASAAQDHSQASYPIVEPKLTDDFVDITSLSMMTASPFALAAPGSPRMLFRTVFNGRYLSNSQTARVDDNTFRDYNHQGTLDRDIVVNFAGESRLFQCLQIQGECQQIIMRDGTRLLRNSEKSYTLTDRNGTIYEFEDLDTRDIDNYGCDSESGCNYAGYYGSAYVKKTKYPEGVVVTHTGLTKISDNIGYSIESNYILSNFSTKIGRITTSVVFTPAIQNGPVYRTIREFNSLGQEYRIELKAEREPTCDGSSLSASNYLPIKIVSPQGVETSITYPPPSPYSLRGNINVGFKYDPPGRRVVPVSTVSRGGRSWQYANGGRTDSLGHTTYYGVAERYNNYDQSYAWNPGCVDNTVGGYITFIKKPDNTITSFEYDDYYRLTKTKYPELNSEEYTYDDRGNITNVAKTSKQGVAQHAFSAGFDATCINTKTCNKPQWTRDALLRQTDYTYDSTHGGILTETLPADANGVRPRKRYIYTAMYATDINGVPITADGPIYKLTAVSSCLSATPGNPDSCVGTSSEQIEEFYYQHPRLLKTKMRKRTGDNSEVKETSFLYNAKDELITIDGPRTDVDDRTYITYDGVGRKIFEISSDPDGTGPLPRSIIRHQYNFDSQEVRTEYGTGSMVDGSDFVWINAKRMTYDDAGFHTKTEMIVP